MALHKVTGFLISMLLVSLLAGCGGEENFTAKKEPSEPLFILSVDGVGPLNAETPFHLIRIGDAFQDFNVAEETHFLKGEKYPVITVKQKTNSLLSINPDFQQKGIFSIVVHDNRVGNKLGHKIGDKYSEIYSYGKTEECAPGMEEWAGKVMCYAPQTGNILYLFEGSWSDADNQVPPPDVMKDWQLKAIVWKPPGK